MTPVFRNKGLNLSPPGDLLAQIDEALASNATVIRAMAPLWFPMAWWIKVRDKLAQTNLRVIWVLGYGDPKYGSEYLAPKGKIADDWAAKAALFTSFMPGEYAIWNEPNTKFWSGDVNDYLVLVSKTVSAIWLIDSTKFIWLGELSLNHSKHEDYYRALMESGHLGDPNIGLSVHFYEPEATLSATFASVASRYATAISEGLQLMVSECGYQQGHGPIVTLQENHAKSDGSRVWTQEGSKTHYPTWARVGAKTGQAFYEQKGTLAEGAYRVTVPVVAYDGCEIGLGISGSDTPRIWVPEGSWVVSAVLTTERVNKGAERLFQLISSEYLWAGDATTVRVDDDPELLNYLRSRSKLAQWETAWDDARLHGLSGAILYANRDSGEETYGLRTKDGAQKLLARERGILW